MDKPDFWKFNNTYKDLPSRFFERVNPAKVPAPKLLQWNLELARELGLPRLADKDLAIIFSGQILDGDSAPLAMAYAGHQFGNFVPRLGDGRALLLGEVVTPNGQRFDIHLKGSGATPFSRNGDGKAALGPVIREYLVSEAMFHLGVPTTRSLAAIATGETIYREAELPGAILTRVASSHIRIGHFEYFASRGDLEGLRVLLDYSIRRHFPALQSSKDSALDFLQEVSRRQAELVAHWMDVGFIHGVMNTDNMLISGETIDYGPCAFMDTFNLSQVFSSIDRHGRYAYTNQAAIAQWNLGRLADCLLLLVDSESAAVIGQFESVLSTFKNIFETHWIGRMKRKLGLLDDQPNDFALIKDWLELLQADGLDYTLSFRDLANRLTSKPTTDTLSASGKAQEFEVRWRARLQQQAMDLNSLQAKMNAVNPLYIPRNHLVERAIQNALAGDLSTFKEMLEVLNSPFTEQVGRGEYAKAPLPNEQVSATFCGT